MTRMTPAARRRAFMPPKLQVLADQAVREATKRGHRIGKFHLEEGWSAAVATCLICHQVAAIDLSESPYTFGQAIKSKCK